MRSHLTVRSDALPAGFAAAASGDGISFSPMSGAAPAGTISQQAAVSAAAQYVTGACTDSTGASDISATLGTFTDSSWGPTANGTVKPIHENESVWIVACPGAQLPMMVPIQSTQYTQLTGETATVTEYVAVDATTGKAIETFG
jgi:hypothetical protein